MIQARRILLICLATLTGLVARALTFEQHKAVLSEQSLPLIGITVNTDQMSANSFLRGHIEIATYAPNDSTAYDSVAYDCLLRYRGTSALLYDKKSFAIKLIDSDGEDLDANVMGIRQENSWILDAMAVDRARMRNRLLFDIWNDLDRTPYPTAHNNRNGTEGQFVELYINNEYHGLYCLSDKIDRKLLGLKKAKVNEDNQVAVRGVLYKATRYAFGTRLMYYYNEPFESTTWNSWELKLPEDYPCEAAWAPLMRLIDFCRQEPEAYGEQWRQHFYDNNFTHYAAFVLAFNIRDNELKNTHLSCVDINNNEQFLITPWDLDTSLGENFNGAYYPALTSLSLLRQVTPYDRLLNASELWFRQLCHVYQQQRFNGLFDPDSVAARTEAYRLLLTDSGAWQREVERWNGNPVALHDDLAQEIDYMINWYTDNVNNLDQILTIDPVEGDLNGDGIVDIYELNIVTNIILGLHDPLPEADLDGNGTIDVSDVNAILNLIIEGASTE